MIGFLEDFGLEDFGGSKAGIMTSGKIV